MTPSTAASNAGSGRTAEADFSVRARKTIAASAAEVFSAWADSRRREHWLIGVTLSIRESRAPAFVRLICEDDNSDIAVSITSRGAAVSALVVDHTHLADAEIAAERRHCWKEMLQQLKGYLERPA